MKLFEFLGRQSNLFFLIICSALVILTGLVDLITGEEISFSLFYVFPISMAAWFTTRWIGIVFSILSAFVWFLADVASGHVYSHFLIPYWNALVRLGLFSIISMLLTTLRYAHEHEKQLARTDALTGLLNRRAFYDVSRLEIERARRFKRPLSIAYIDLDNFKAVNDLFGHSTGDTLLCLVADSMKNHVRAIDATARFGGDEFALLLPETDAESARFVINKLQERITAHMLTHDWPVTLSIGMATFVTPPENVDSMIRYTDNLMYRTKTSGKNSITQDVFDTKNSA
jgi:diguanylate cyclase (GGDEF)-like protein